MSEAGSTRTGNQRDDRPASEPVAIAAIDVDGTLFPDRAAQHALLGILSSTGTLGWPAYARLFRIYIAHRLRLTSPAQARAQAASLVDGVPWVEVEALAEPLSVELVSKVRPAARTEITALRARGLRVLLVSASLGPIVARLADGLGADGYLASELDVVDGRCSGTFAGPVLEGPEKWRSLRRYADTHFGRGGWRLAAAYGNSLGDLDLFEQADQAIAVNAHRKLARVAVRRGWGQVDWEKSTGAGPSVRSHRVVWLVGALLLVVVGVVVARTAMGPRREAPHRAATMR